MPKIGYGEVDYPDRNASQAYLRNAFLDTVQHHAQYALKDLHNNLSLFLSLSEQERRLTWLHFYGNRLLRIKTFVRAVEDWARKYNLNAPWCIENAIYTCQQWSHFSKVPDELSFSSEGGGGVRPTIDPPYEGGPEYDPTGSRKAYLDRIHVDAQEVIESNPLLNLSDALQRSEFINSIVAEVEKYCIEAEKHCHELGYPPFNEKRKLEKHLIWTVQFQVCEKSYSEIARNNKVNTSTVKRAIEDILQAIDLPSRKIHSGRPKGQKDSPGITRRRVR
jgi:hypothetical protein